MSQNGWHRVDPADVPADGRVRSVVVDGRTVALSRCGLRLGALENRYGIPIKHVLLDNGVAHLVAQPGLGGLCTAVRATGIQVTSRDQLDEAMRALFACDGPALLCVEQDAELL